MMIDLYIRLRRSQKRIICPQCFYSFKPWKVFFKCSNKECSENLKIFEIDVKNKPLKKLFNCILVPLKEPCPKCNNDSFTRVCHNCKSDLPETAGLSRCITIAIIGNKKSSKTHYFTALHKTIITKLASKYRFHIRQAGGWSESSTIEWKEYNDSLYPNDGKMPRVVPLTGKTDLKFPFEIYYKKRNKLDAMHLLFWDNKGESYLEKNIGKDPDRTRYIRNADAYIVLLDPVIYEKVKQKFTVEELSKMDYVPDDFKMKHEEIIESIIRENANVPGKAAGTILLKSIKKPIAICVAKVDELKEVINNDIISDHYEGKVEDFFEMLRQPEIDDIQWSCISKIVRKHLKEWDGHLCNKIEDKFTEIGYFAVASLGCRPAADGTLKDFDPIRVEDPLDWVIRQLNLFRKQPEE